MVTIKPCDWPVSYAGCEGEAIPEPLASLPASGRQAMEDMATEYLWRWTGMRLGTCELTIRPCREDCTDGRSTFNGSGPSVGGLLWHPVIIDGRWINVSCGRCGDRCGCGGAAPLRLPGPIASVASVSEGDDVLAPDAYHVENDTLLVRTDGKRWDPCGLEIVYDRGVSVPIGGQIAAGVLALELTRASCNDGECRLPQRLQTVTRQGVSIAIIDSFDDVEKGHTGIWIIDSWVASMTKPVAPPRVLSPDKPRRQNRRTTWT